MSVDEDWSEALVVHADECRRNRIVTAPVVLAIALAACLTGCSSRSLADGVESATPERERRARNHASYAVWTAALDVEIADMRMFAENDPHFVLLAASTLIVTFRDTAVDGLDEETVIRETLAAMPVLREETARAFMAAARKSVDLEPGGCATELPSRLARPGEMTEFLSPARDAEQGLLGVMAVTDVGFSSDGSQAFTYVHAWRVETPNPFRWLMVLERQGGSWKCVAQMNWYPLALPLSVSDG